MRFIVTADTDIGTTKDTNQDSVLVKHAIYQEQEVLMAIVCDGMGGLSKGELASATVIRAFNQWFDEELEKELNPLDMQTIGNKWECMLKDLNLKISEYGIDIGTSLGTTFSGILFVDDSYVVAHVGDSYVKAGNVSNINGELINQTIPESSIAYSNNGKIATAKFEIPSGALGATTQFNGNVEFTATDRTGLSSGVKGTKRLVVDNISPTISVSYNDPVSEIEGILYYDENVTATITIEEANFYAEDVKVMVTKDEGTPYDVTPQWEGNHTDIHVGTILLAEDGNYTISITL